MSREKRAKVDVHFERYADLMSSMPDLNADQERTLILRWREHADIDARNRIIFATMKVAVAVSWQHRRFGVPFDDMVNLGAIGIMKALETYDLSRGVRFGSHAWSWIRAMITRAECRQWSMVSGQPTSSGRLFCLLKLMARGQSIHGSDRDAVYQYVADQLHVPVASAMEWLTLISGRVISLEGPAPFTDSEDATCMKDELVSNYDPPVDSQVESDEIRRMIRAKLDTFSQTLTPRQNKIVQRRLLQAEPESLEVIAAEEGISRETLRQIELILCSRIRKLLREEAEEMGISTPPIVFEKTRVEHAEQAA